METGKYHTLLFDLDGTLLDTLGDLADATNYALRQKHFPERTEEEVRMFVGNGVAKLIERALPADIPADIKEKKSAETLAVFRPYYAEHSRVKTKPYDGILPTLRTLFSRGYRMAVISNKFEQAVEELNQAYFSDCISVCIGEDPSRRRKPAPDSLFAAAKKLGSAPGECLYVGDSDVDVAAAHHASMPCIGCVWGFRGRTILISCGADFIVDRPEEMIPLLEKLNNGEKNI